jgi:hypothetical protein
MQCNYLKYNYLIFRTPLKSSCEVKEVFDKNFSIIMIDCLDYRKLFT